MKILGTTLKLLTFLIILFLLGLFGYALFGNRATIHPSHLLGTEAPDFTLKLFNGEQLRLSDLRGKAVLINFWASWCAPCREEAPVLEASWRKYREKPVVFIGINIWDDKDSALSFLTRFGGNYPNGADPKGEIAINYGVAGVPETYFIDPTGKIVGKYAGQLTNEIVDYFMEKSLLGSKNTAIRENER